MIIFHNLNQYPGDQFKDCVIVFEVVLQVYIYPFIEYSRLFFVATLSRMRYYQNNFIEEDNCFILDILEQSKSW